jgi:hypothetical protein
MGALFGDYHPQSRIQAHPRDHEGSDGIAEQIAVRGKADNDSS